MYQVDSESAVPCAPVWVSSTVGPKTEELPRLIQQADMACHIAREAGRRVGGERIHLYNR